MAEKLFHVFALQYTNSCFQLSVIVHYFVSNCFNVIITFLKWYFAHIFSSFSLNYAMLFFV